ncbi:MAG TPA: DUF2723 domain-containing protein, partial [Chloroflexota bacterium]|nr:DUF2723 domain-containing protein [Chloroflexota bacterium]
MLLDHLSPTSSPAMPHPRTARRAALWWAPVVVTLVAAAIYLLTLAPSITTAFGTGDSGELASTAYTLGIAHPTGYPLYTLLGYAVTHLGAEPARGLNIFSALMGALAVSLLACLGWRCARSALPSASTVTAAAACALAAVPFALSTSFWTEAVTTETRTLALALDGAVLALLILPERVCRRQALAAALLYGLALCDHLLSVYLAPACILLLIPWARARIGRWLALLGCFLLGLSPYLYLPIRAAQGPAANWGDPDTPARFLWVVTGKEYRYEMFGLDASAFLQRMELLFTQMRQELNGLTVLAALVGIVVLARRRPLVAAALAITAVLDLAATTNYQADAAPAYLLLASYCLCIAAACGWLALGQLLAAALRRALPTVVAVTLAALVCLGAGAVAEYPAASTARDAVSQLSTTALRDYGVAVLRSLPPHAILFADDIIFG